MKDYIEIFLLLAILGALLRRKHPAETAAKKAVSNKRRLVIDTCALIDGRIVDLAEAGFVPELLVVPEFVIAELQQLADGSDSHKRERARFGLDVVKSLQENPHTEVEISREQFPGIQAIDSKLVALAKLLGAQLYTTDYNLNKVADIEDVKVLNVNELAQQLRPVALPGEKKTVKILQKGSSRGQGVGYLEDGTMIVIDGAAQYIGYEVTAGIIRSLQTVAGKMMFAELVDKPQSAQPASGKKPLRFRARKAFSSNAPKKSPDVAS